jgi:glycosyltransferase involved in cell wall biosynthesis
MKTRTEGEIISGWQDRGTALVTVCCATYNHEDYVREAIESFLAQETEFPFEIIIHDDASTDGTAAIVLEYAERYPRLIRTIIQNENQYSKAGLISPRFVFPEAQGKYLALCEGDDYWTDPGKLQKQVTFLENNPDYVITYSDCQPFDENGIIDHDYRGARRDLTATELKRATPIFTLTSCFRNVIGKVPLDVMSARYGDMVIWSLLGHHGKGKYLADVMPSAYRVHDRGLHSRKDDNQRAVMRLITISALYAYYVRIGDDEIARFFKSRMFMTLLHTMGFGFLYYFARTCLRIWRKITRRVGQVFGRADSWL